MDDFAGHEYEVLDLPSPQRWVKEYTVTIPVDLVYTWPDDFQTIEGSLEPTITLEEFMTQPPLTPEQVLQTVFELEYSMDELVNVEQVKYNGIKREEDL
jgi:hypothetical protein